ncbi:hypothetical protein ACTXT7_006587 [Hymenolepis weldensis]
MPSSLVNKTGIFDLFVYKVRNSDQTSFSCQVTIQTFRLMQPPRVKTLTSSTIFITIYTWGKGIATSRFAVIDVKLEFMIVQSISKYTEANFACSIPWVSGLK